MKYKIGNKVRIKSWEDMKKEYGIHKQGNVLKVGGFNIFMEKYINKHCPDRILTIKKVSSVGYTMTTGDYIWNNYMIKCLAKDCKPSISITSRFEILDI